MSKLPEDVLFQHNFQAMYCLMFQNQKSLNQSDSDSVTRSPIKLFWTAKNTYISEKLKREAQSFLVSSNLPNSVVHKN